VTAGTIIAVIASEAKQSITPRKERLDCFVAVLLAMTTWVQASVSGDDCGLEHHR